MLWLGVIPDPDSPAWLPMWDPDGVGFALPTYVKKASFKLTPARGGWIRNTISPVHDKTEAKFGLIDIVVLISLVVGTVAVARVFLAH